MLEAKNQELESQLRARGEEAETPEETGSAASVEEWRPGSPEAAEAAAPSAGATEPTESPNEDGSREEQARELRAWQAKCEALAQENSRLARLTSISGSPPARLGSEPPRELGERDLRRMAREFDAEFSY